MPSHRSRPLRLGSVAELAQELQETLAVARPDDAVEIAGRVALRTRSGAASIPMARGRERELIAAPVALQAAARDQAAPLQIAERRGEGRLVAAVRAAKRRLADAGIAADQQSEARSGRAEVDLCASRRRPGMRRSAPGADGSPANLRADRSRYPYGSFVFLPPRSEATGPVACPSSTMRRAPSRALPAAFACVSPGGPASGKAPARALRLLARRSISRCR